MATKVEESYTEREQKVDADGNLIEIEIPYLVFGVGNETAALSAARPKAIGDAPKGMALETVEVSERVGDDIWRVKARFAVSEDGGGGEEQEDAYIFTFDTGGGTMHRNQSLKTVSKSPNDAPDFGGAIEVDNEGNVNGVDVTMPIHNFTETHTKKGTEVTANYRKKVAELTGTVNKASFRGFSAGEVLFLGASGSKRSKKASANWEITYRFAVSQNKSSFKVGEVEVSQKRGWDYLWVRYSDKVSESGKNMIKTPSAVYVEEVYPEGDFNELGLGV